MNKIKVSIVVPVYNTADYLEQAIGSILAQTLREIEVIAINDGSTDDSLATLYRLQQSDDRLVIHSQYNQGLSATRNAGLELAQGEFIYFFDSDDFLQKEALAGCYKIAHERGCDVVFFDAAILDNPSLSQAMQLPYQRKGVLDEQCTYIGTEAFDKLLARGKFSSSVCLHFIRTNYLRVTGLRFYPGILHEDQLFTCLLLLQADRVSYIPYDYFLRRVRKHSIMTSPVSHKNIEGYLAVCCQLNHYCKTEPSIARCRLARKQITALVQVTASTAIVLSFRKRMILLRTLVCHYPLHLHVVSFFLLLFPFLKRTRKK